MSRSGFNLIQNICSTIRVRPELYQFTIKKFRFRFDMQGKSLQLYHISDSTIYGNQKKCGVTCSD